MIIFLGAGASKPFGIPTMKEFVEEFEKELKGKDSNYRGTSDELRIYKNIRTNIQRLNVDVDLEALLSILDGRSQGVDPKKFGVMGAHYIDYIVRTLQPFDWSNAKKVSDRGYVLPPQMTPILSPNPTAKELSNKLRNFIKDRCTKVDTKKILEVYDRFFTALVDAIKINSLNISCQEDNMPYPAINIFTTNYDRCVEIYCKERGIKLERGFKYNKSKGKSILDTHIVNNAEFLNTSRSKDIGLFKLHGSIDWRKIGDDIVELFVPADQGDRTIDDEKIEREVMIYPGERKDTERDPFYYMFYFLKRELECKNICLVIGYSFRDGPINSIFFDAVKRNPKLKIILLDPNANEIVDKRLDLIKDNVTPIKGEFGNGKILEELPIGKMTIARKKKVEKFKKKHQLPAGIGDDISELIVVDQDGEKKKFKP